MDALTADLFCSDLCLAMNLCHASAQHTRAQDGTWDIWLTYCATHQVDPLLASVPDPIPYLQVFAQCFHDGWLAKNGNPLQARSSVEDALCAIGQMMASMGATDQRLISSMSLDYHLNQQLAGYWCVDPAPTCVTPTSLHLIDYGYEVAHLSGTTLSLTTIDMANIGFFYLNCPGEYSKPTTTDSLSTPFCLCDIELSIGRHVFNVAFATLKDIQHATFASLI
jgi:hypothetical protein